MGKILDQLLQNFQGFLQRCHKVIPEVPRKETDEVDSNLN